MATSSITKNFVISGQTQVDKFIKAIEDSASDRPVYRKVAAKEIKGERELRKIMRLRKMNQKETMNAGKG